MRRHFISRNESTNQFYVHIKPSLGMWQCREWQQRKLLQWLHVEHEHSYKIDLLVVSCRPNQQLHAILLELVINGSLFGLCWPCWCSKMAKINYFGVERENHEYAINQWRVRRQERNASDRVYSRCKKYHTNHPTFIASRFNSVNISIVNKLLSAQSRRRECVGRWTARVWKRRNENPCLSARSRINRHPI